MVLYHCCVSLDRANEIVAKGFDAEELVHVTTEPPLEDWRTAKQTHAVVYLGPPFGFSTGDYPITVNERGDPGWLVPGVVLNSFPRAVWPRPD